MKRAPLMLVVASVLAGAWALTGARAAPTFSGPYPDFPVSGTNFYLRECASLPDAKRRRCYIKGLLADVEKSHDPARELPQIDQVVHRNGGYLESNCHIFMHQVGRTWARRHNVTLENLYDFVPRSNDPGCSAGFGMGLVMHLGTQIILAPRSVIPTCSRLPTRFREYTCVHGTGHALMRGYHGQLAWAVRACTKLGPRFAPDCAQGAFHDYWLSLSGVDGTTRPKRADTDPRSVCARFAYPRPCWYRFFWERRPSERVGGPEDFVRLCGDLDGLQRAGCIGGASLLVVRERESADHARICSRLAGSDALDCLRGVNVPVVVGNRWEQLRLIRTCSRFPKQARNGCYAWFGRTIAVVTNGRFERSGCPRLKIPAARAACVASARRMDAPLATFS